MPERDGYIPGVPCWVDTIQPHPEAAVAFYGGLFGWQFEDVMPQGSDRRYFIGRIRGGNVAAVGSIPPGAPPTATWNTYVWVDDTDETAQRVEQARGRVLAAPFDVPGAGRMAECADPSGAGFRIWQAREHRGAQLVNVPASWNWSNLNTPDAEGAIRFTRRYSAGNSARWTSAFPESFTRTTSTTSRWSRSTESAPSSTGSTFAS